MSREVDLEDVEEASDLSDEDLAYLAEREGTTQGLSADQMQELGVDAEKVRSLLDPEQQDPNAKPRKSKARKAKRSRKSKAADVDEDDDSDDDSGDAGSASTEADDDSANAE